MPPRGTWCDGRGLTPQAVLSLVMAGAFDGISSNRREALWEAGLYARPPRNGQATLPVSMEDSVPRLTDFTTYEKMLGEYRVMGIYPEGPPDGVRQANPG